MARIASFDGGGVRGVGPAYWCSIIEHSTGKPMADMFNLCAGTSTGAIIATSLVCQKSSSLDSLWYTGMGDSLYSGDDILNLYIQESENLFVPRSLLGYLFVSKYKSKPVYNCFEKYFDEIKLSQIRPDCDLLVTYHNLTNNIPDFFKSNKARQVSYARDRDYYLKDVLASTTAAPTFF